LCILRNANSAIFVINEQSENLKLTQKYPNPPITEAVLEVRVSATAELAAADLEQLQERYPKYPLKNRKQLIEGIISGGESPTSEAKQTHIGFTFTSDDGKQIVQAGVSSFSFSRLSPYQGWDTFASEGRKLWPAYKEVAQPLSVSRIGLRFINRLDLPWPFEDFKEFLRTSPEVSPDMTQLLSNFLMVLESPQDDIKAMMRLSEVLLPPAAENLVSIMLDIDLYRLESLPLEDDSIWEYLEQLRERKNQIFEACITDKARELFQ
jgi:uncharacterized protein (TIGR04255 family)